VTQGKDIWDVVGEGKVVDTGPRACISEGPCMCSPLWLQSLCLRLLESEGIGQVLVLPGVCAVIF